jgi:hypothetical protein
MLRDGWNFHGDIAIPLENIARGYFSIEPLDQKLLHYFFSADTIECGAFVEVMLYLLRSKLGLDADLSEFVSKSKAFLGCTAREIPHKISQSLFTDFEKLFD